MRGMREGDGGRVAGIPPDDTARKVKGRAVELGSLSHGRRTTNVLAGLPDQGRAEDLPCGGMHRKGWDTDSDADEFTKPACPGHRDNLGGGKPPTPKVLTMRHAGTVAGTKWEAPRHRDVQERGRTEETADSGDRAEGQHGEGLRGLRESNRNGHQVQITGADNDGGG